jgi:DNA-binding HxlR family transcriptional regulator
MLDRVTCILQVTFVSGCGYAGRMPSRARSAVADRTRARRSLCPVACTLDVLGDRWTLLVVRDLMRGKRRFGEFLGSSEKIPTNILADRLQRLVASGVVVAQPYSEHPPRMEYALTAKGEDLRPVIRAMVAWGVRHAGGRMPSPASSR